MSADASGVRYAVETANGYVCGGFAFSTDSLAWAEAARMDKECACDAPHAVVALTPVPRPIPARPSIAIGDAATVVWEGGFFVVTTRERKTRHEYERAGVVAFQWLHTDNDLRDLLTLRERTEAWEVGRAAHASAEAGETEVWPEATAAWSALQGSQYVYDPGARTMLFRCVFDDDRKALHAFKHSTPPARVLPEGVE